MRKARPSQNGEEGQARPKSKAKVRPDPTQKGGAGQALPRREGSQRVKEGKAGPDPRGEDGKAKSNHDMFKIGVLWRQRLPKLLNFEFET